MEPISLLIFGIIAILFIGIVSVFLLIPVFKKQIRDEMKTSQDQYLQLAKQQFEAEQNKAVTAFETRKQVVETNIRGLEDELKEYRKLIKEFEADRERKYGNLESELKSTSQVTLKLQESTNQLNNILGNVKLRGQWGVLKK